jgi:hypothetical protein
MTARFNESTLIRLRGRSETWTLLDAADVAWVRQWEWTATTVKGITYGLRKDETGRTVWLHRALMNLHYGDGREIDHINGDGLDNRRGNLRIVNHAQNLQNQRKQANRSSRYRGVSLYKRDGVWVAQMKLNGVRHYLGRYRTEDEAGAVSAAWRAEHMPFSVEAAGGLHASR